MREAIHSASRTTVLNLTAMPTAGYRPTTRVSTFEWKNTKVRLIGESASASRCARSAGGGKAEATAQLRCGQVSAETRPSRLEGGGRSQVADDDRIAPGIAHQLRDHSHGRGVVAGDGHADAPASA